jgi:hypothetical protein
MIQREAVIKMQQLARENRERETAQLVRDLMELALDNRQPECERSFIDSARRYCELRNEAVRLGYCHGKIIPLGKESEV